MGHSIGLAGLELEKRKNGWIYFLVKVMVKLLTEQDELLESLSVINQNK